MQFSSPSTPAELKEVLKFRRPKNFWWNFIVYNLYGALLLVGALAVVVAASINDQPVRWDAFGILLALAVFRIGLSYSRWQARNEKLIAAGQPAGATWTLDSAGIRSDTFAGLKTFVPWSSYSAWREGKYVFLISGKGTQSIALPVTDANRDLVRGILQSHIR